MSFSTPQAGGTNETVRSRWVDHQLAQTGVYTIVITDYLKTNPGNYHISFLKIPGNTSSAADPDGGPIASGQTLHGTINAPSDLDAYQIYGKAGERLLINADYISSPLTPYIFLYPPDGQSSEAVKSFWVDHQLSKTGVYTVVVKDHLAQNTGDYHITVIKTPGATSHVTDREGGMINSGQTLGGAITPTGDVDAYCFYGNAGERAIVSVAATSGSLDPYVFLYGPEGAPQEKVKFGGFDHQLLRSGLYTILIKDYLNQHTGSYTISFTKIPSTTPLGIFHSFPGNGAHVVNPRSSFRWSPVADATGYDVYFGEDVVQPLEKIADGISSPTFPFPATTIGKVYSWRVVAHTPGGEVYGPHLWFQRVRPVNPFWLLLLLGH